MDDYQDLGLQGRKKMFSSGGADVYVLICAHARGKFLMATPTLLNHAHFWIPINWFSGVSACD